MSKFDHRKLALSMSSTKVAKNRYHSISLILTLQQSILITIISWQPLVFILSPSFLSISADALHIFSLHFETFITRWFNWALLHLLCFKRQDTHQDASSFIFAFDSYYTCIIQDLFLPKFLARICS